MIENPTDSDLTTVRTGGTAPGWTIPAPRGAGQYGADRALASRLHALADVVALRGRPGPTRVEGLPRVLVVPAVVHDLVCAVRVATEQPTVPPVAHCAACGLCVQTDAGDQADDQAEKWAVPLGPDTGDDPGLDERTVRMLLSAGAAIQREQTGGPPVAASRFTAVKNVVEEPRLDDGHIVLLASAPFPVSDIRDLVDAIYDIGHDDGFDQGVSGARAEIADAIDGMNTRDRAARTADDTAGGAR